MSIKIKELIKLGVELGLDISSLEATNEKAKHQGLTFSRIDKAINLLKETATIIDVKIKYVDKDN